MSIPIQPNSISNRRAFWRQHIHIPASSIKTSINSNRKSDRVWGKTGSRSPAVREAALSWEEISQFLARNAGKVKDLSAKSKRGKLATILKLPGWMTEKRTRALTAPASKARFEVSRKVSVRVFAGRDASPKSVSQTFTARVSR